MSMSKVSRWGLAKHDELCEVVTAVTASGMPKGKAHGLMFSIVDSINRDHNGKLSLQYGKDAVSLPKGCVVEINGKQGLEQSGPYFVIYTVINTAEPDEEIIPEPGKAFLSPIHSVETLIPISSELDRILIDKAIANLKFNEKKGNQLVFIRPLYPYISPLSERRVWTSQLSLDSLLFQKIRFFEFSR
jgi:hypothetical protein